MANEALKTVTTRKSVTATPQTEKAAKGQKKNHAGGYAFVIGDFERIKRFLIMGSESSFYQSGAKLALENAKTIQKVAQSGDAEQVRALFDLIEEISVGGRAAKQQPALFALALAIASTPDRHLKSYGYSKVASVARTASTLFQFAGYLNQFQRFGMGARKAISRWYEGRDLDALAYQLVKYQAREGWSNDDLISLSHPTRSKEDPEFSRLIDWTLGKAKDIEALPKIVQGFERAKGAESDKIPSLIREYGLSWEMVPSEALNRRETWEALLDTKGALPLGALIRNLPKLTRTRVIQELGGRTQEIVDRLTDQDALVKARIHPLNLLVALKTYAEGEGRGGRDFTPVRRIVDALDTAFYKAFKAVEPTSKRWFLALDVSGSMGWGNISGMPITPREASAALSLVTAATEKESYIAGFSHTMVPIDISANMTLDEVQRRISRIPMGGTDCALPMLHALEKGIKADVFVIYTDSETWAGRVHPHEALERYRKATGINAKLIVVGMTATRFSIANPNDPGMLDIAGFDTAAPGLMAEFVKD